MRSAIKNPRWDRIISIVIIILMYSGAIWAGNNKGSDKEKKQPSVQKDENKSQPPDDQKHNPLPPSGKGDSEKEQPDNSAAKNEEKPETGILDNNTTEEPSGPPSEPQVRDSESSESQRSEQTNSPADQQTSEPKISDSESSGSLNEPSAKNKPEKWDGDPEGTASSEVPGKGDNRDDTHSGKIDVLGDGNSGNNNQNPADRQFNSPTDKQTSNPVVQQSNETTMESRPNQNETRGPDQITPGSDNGQGDNRDDKHSGKVDLVGDGNSGQKPTDKPLTPPEFAENRKPEYKPQPIDPPPLTTPVPTPEPNTPPDENGFALAKVEKVEFESEEKFEGVRGNANPDPSIINLKLVLEPVDYNRRTDSFQVKVTIESVKVKHMDERCHFTYDFGNPKHCREAWNQLYKAVSDAADFRKKNNDNNRPEFYGYSREFFDEMIKTLGCAALPKRSFTAEISRFGETVKPAGLDQMLTEGLQSLPQVSEINHLKQMLTEHITQTLRLIFPPIPRKHSTENGSATQFGPKLTAEGLTALSLPKGGLVTDNGETVIKYAHQDQQKETHRKQNKTSNEFYYSLSRGLVVSNETVENNSSIEFVGQNGRTGTVTSRLEWEKTRHKISLVKVDKK